MLKRTKNDGESGMMVVEAVIGFTAFIMVCLGILFITNIFILHNRVQFAINSAAHEIASYSYIYSALSLQKASNTLEKDGEAYVKPIDDTANQISDTLNKMNETMAGISGITSSVQNLEISEELFDKLDEVKANGSATLDGGKKSISMMSDLFKNPKGTLTGIIYLGVSGVDYTLKSIVGAAAAKGMTEKYLEYFGKSADEYLTGFGVVGGYDGLDFSGSSLFNDSGDRMVDIVVEYDLDFSYINFVFPSRIIHVVQRVSVGGWVNGDGVEVNIK